jgi:hypothetical protein
MAEPPKDLPPPSEQSAVEASASFQPSPTGASLCGFGVPGFSFSLSIPSFQIPSITFPPSFNFGIALNCSLSDPFDADFGFGGGRVSNYDPDSEDEE